MACSRIVKCCYWKSWRGKFVLPARPTATLEGRRFLWRTVYKEGIYNALALSRSTNF